MILIFMSQEIIGTQRAITYSVYAPVVIYSEVDIVKAELTLGIYRFGKFL